MPMFELETVLQIPKANVSRRLLALERMHPLVEQEAVLVPLVPELEVVIDEHRDAVQWLLRWRNQKTDKAMHAQQAQELDAQVDNQLSNVLALVRAARGAHEPGSPKHVAAALIEDREFASGVYPITSLAFADEHVAVNALLRNLGAPPLLEAVKAIDMVDAVDRLAKLNAAYGAAVSQRADIDYDDVVASNQSSIRMLTSWMAKVLGALPGIDGPDREARERVFAPYEAQVAEYRLLRARRAAQQAGEFPLDDESADELDEELEDLNA